MNPEVEDSAAAFASPARTSSSTNPLRKSHIFQRRLKEKISESRALEVLDRKLQSDRTMGAQVPTAGTGVGVSLDSNQEDELVCDSTMVRFEAPVVPEEFSQRVCGVIKTVRGIHRQRAQEQPARENQGS